MKRNHLPIILGMALIALLMGSCDALFTNQFQTLGLGQVSSEDLQKADAESLIAQSGINDGRISQSFIDAALADDDTKAIVLSELNTAAGDSDPEIAQTAQVLIIEIELQDSGADEIVGNVGSMIDVITNDDNFDPSTPEDLNALIDALIPDGVSGDELANMFDALTNLGVPGGEIDTLGGNLVANSGLQNDNIDAGTLAQTAVMASVLATLDPVAPGTTTGEALVAALADPDNFNTYINIPDSDGDGLSDLEELGDNANLAAILQAGGLTFLLDAING